MNNYFFNLYQSFIKVHGMAVALLGVGLGLVAFVYAPTDNVSLKVVIPLSIIVFLVLITLIDNSIQNYKKITNILPKVKQARAPTALHQGAKAILLLEPSDIYAHETLISVYFLENDFERLIGIGFILTIQGNGLIQVLVNKALEEQGENIWKKICQNDVNVLTKLHVKPSIPKILNDLGD